MSDRIVTAAFRLERVHRDPLGRGHGRGHGNGVAQAGPQFTLERPIDPGAVLATGQSAMSTSAALGVMRSEGEAVYGTTPSVGSGVTDRIRLSGAALSGVSAPAAVPPLVPIWWSVLLRAWGGTGRQTDLTRAA